MASEIVTRIATPADAAELARLNAEFNDVHETPEELATRMRDPRQVETPVLAEVEGRIVGFAALRLVPSLFYVSPQAELTELYVEPEYRRRGVGRALIAYVERLARDQGAKALLVRTGLTNQAAQALYRSVGFKDEELAMYKDLPSD